MKNEYEIWAPAIYITETGDIIDFSDNYQVSNQQKIKYLNFEHHKGLVKIKDLSNAKTKKRYVSITLTKDGKQHKLPFHRLVLSSFCQKSPVYECINHKDCNTRNNNLNNLEWCTYLYNNTYNNRHITAAEKLKGKTNTSNSKPVLQISLDGNLINEWPSAAEIKRQLGYNTPSIINCCNQKPKYLTAYGFIWRFKF